MKKLIWGGSILLLLVVVWLAGPRFPEPVLNTDFPRIEIAADRIVNYIEEQEAAYAVKPDNQSLVLWGDGVGKKTEYVLLYLHGFSASRYEAYPVTHDFVREFHVNAYLPRLAEHGLQGDDALLNMTPERLYASAREALAIAHNLGNKVVIMGTSTGCTLALMLAADFPAKVEGLILYSPNIRIDNLFAPLLSGPWGLQIARLAYGGKYRQSEDAPDSKICQYWNCSYRLEATVYLQQLLDARMTEAEFAKVQAPVFLGYYYKDKKHQDPTIDVKAALWMYDALGTPEDRKVKIAFPNAGAHVIACELTSGSFREVEEETFTFFREMILK